ncbi:MAG: ATP-dependent DNA helicase RecG, partial [Alphaproteobacteria bacterium]|nr:ATP-dependent DNA helicase RecG [Alphaproteobacteria bacterium]
MGILSARPEPPETAEDPLAQLLAPIESLPGLRKPDLLARAAGGGRVLDLLLHVPERVQHRPVLRGLAGASEGQEVTLELRITGAPARGGRGPWMVPAVCGADPVALISFSRATWAGTALGRAFPQGAERRVA